MPLFPRFLPLAEHPRFHSDATGRPFERCLVCETAFLDAPDLEYMIEKAYRRRPDLDAEELIFEYAICMTCLDVMEAAFSEASQAHIEQFYADRVDFEARFELFMQAAPPDPADLADACAVYGTPVAELEEYQLIAQARGGWLELGALPAVIGGAAIDELAEGLSAQTLGEARRFRDDFLGLPPELEDLLRDRYLV